MGEFNYKEYTEEENIVYERAVPEILELVKKGLPFTEACDRVQVEDSDLKGYIVDDALKIILAEMHFNQQISIEEISHIISVSPDVLTKAQREMMQDVAVSASEFFRQTNPDGHCGNA